MLTVPCRDGSAWLGAENCQVISGLVGGFSTHRNWTAGCEQSYILRVTRNWLFPSPYGTGRPRWPWTIQRDHLLPAGLRAGLGPIGWHGFRHSYSMLLPAAGAAVPEAMREANSKVVGMVLPLRKVR